MRQLLLVLLLIQFFPFTSVNGQTVFGAPVGQQVGGTLSTGDSITYMVSRGLDENYEAMVLLNITSSDPIYLDIIQSKDGFSSQRFYFGKEFLTMFYFNLVSGVTFEMQATQDNTEYIISATELQNISSIEMGKSGFLSFTGETQFQFSLNQTATIRAIFWGFELNAILSQGLSDGSEALGSLSNFGYGNMNAKTQVLDLDAGDYTIDVSSNIANIMSVAVLITTDLDMHELNDDIDSATEFYVGQAIWGRMGKDTDEDWYRVPGPFEGTLLYTYNTPVGRALDGEFATASDLNYLDNSYGFFVKVNSGEDFIFGVFSTYTDFDYQILIEVVQPDTFEPDGNTKDDATPVQTDLRRLSIHEKDDVDWYKFHLEHYSEVEIVVNYNEGGLRLTPDFEDNTYYNFEQFSGAQDVTVNFEGNNGDYYFYIDAGSLAVPEYSIFIRITSREDTNRPSTSQFKIPFPTFLLISTLVILIKVKSRIS